MEKLQKSVYLLTLFSFGFAGLYFAAPFLIPLTMAAIFAMLFIKLCNYLESKKINHAFASLLCILIFVLVIGTVLTLLGFQLSNLSENLDAMKERVYNLFNDLRNWLNTTFGLTKTQQKEMIKQQGGDSAGMLVNFASGFMGIVFNAVLVLVYMYLFLYYRSHIKKFILKLTPQGDKNTTENVVHQTGAVAQKYLSGLAAMIGILWIMYGIGFTLLGVEYALFFAVLCGILEIIPFIGNLTGTTLTVLGVIAQGGNNQIIFGVIAVYIVVQFIQTYLLEPLIVGEQVNINPLFTIMVIVLGEMIWGVARMILAIPLLGMVKIICDHYPALQPYGFLIGTENPRKPKTNVIAQLKKWFGKKVK